MLIEIRYPSALKYLRQMCQISKDMAQSAVDIKLDDTQKLKFLQEVELMTGEACTNSIRHNTVPNTGELILRIRYTQKVFEVIVMDQNPEFDFYALSGPKFDDIPESGYGIHIIKTLSDEVIFKRENTWNKLWMIKKIPTL